MAGTAFGVGGHALFGAAVGAPARYGMVAMGAVLASAAHAPLTSMMSAVEMTGDFSLTLAVGIAAAVSRKLTHGTIDTSRLLRRGTDDERVTPASVLDQFTVGDAMQPFAMDFAATRGRNVSDAADDAESDDSDDAGRPTSPS